MIRFIYIGEQITLEKGDQEFAFFNTVVERFVIVGNSYVFDSKEDFEECVRIECDNRYGLTPQDESYERLRILIPDNIK